METETPMQELFRRFGHLLPDIENEFLTKEKAILPQANVTRSFFNNCFRILEDNFCGYEVQIKRWWFPFWVQKHKYGCINTFRNLEDAKQWIKDGCPKSKPQKERERIIFWKNCG